MTSDNLLPPSSPLPPNNTPSFEPLSKKAPPSSDPDEFKNLMKITDTDTEQKKKRREYKEEEEEEEAPPSSSSPSTAGSIFDVQPPQNAPTSSVRSSLSSPYNPPEHFPQDLLEMLREKNEDPAPPLPFDADFPLYENPSSPSLDTPPSQETPPKRKRAASSPSSETAPQTAAPHKPPRKKKERKTQAPSSEPPTQLEEKKAPPPVGIASKKVEAQSLPSEIPSSPSPQLTPSSQERPTLPPSSTPLYMHPLVQALFERMAGVMTVLDTAGIKETSFTLNAPQFASSVFYGVRIIIQEYSTAPRVFNIELIGSPEAVALLQTHTEELLAAFQQGRYSFSVHRLQARLESGPPLVKRKRQKGSQEKEEKAP